MKLTFLHFALPLAFVAALPLLDVADNMNPHSHGQEMAFHHTPPPALAPWESVHMDGFREERMNNKMNHAFHFDAARAELKLATLHMSREAVVNAGSNDADMDIAFNLENGLADLTSNSAGADADINNDFSLDNELSDLSGNTAAADAEINAQFSAGK